MHNYYKNNNYAFRINFSEILTTEYMLLKLHLNSVFSQNNARFEGEHKKVGDPW